MRAMPVKGVEDIRLEGCCSPSCPAAEESASFFSAGQDAIFNCRSLGVFRLREISFVVGKRSNHTLPSL